MVYNPNQLQGGQQYGQPGAQPVYGQPPAQTASQAMPDVKWSGLSSGGSQYKTPLVRFIGKLDGFQYDTQSKYGLRVVLKNSQVQILEATAQYPYATADISIRYSDSESGGWGKFVASAKALGFALNAATLEEAIRDLAGKSFEWLKKHEEFGEDKEGKPMAGDVWYLVRVVGQPAQPVMGTPQPQPQPVYAPNVVMAAPVVAPAPASAPAPAPSMGFNPTIISTDTAAIRAKKYLHGRGLSDWLGVALVDPVVKMENNGALVNQILDQSFIISLKSSGQVRQEADGRFTVLS